ncbi:methyl-accepting chemotaxis protein [Oscillospiraceae bacterium PP1C4]
MKTKKIGTRILFASGICILLTSVLTLAIMYIGNHLNVENILKSDMEVSSSVMLSKVDSMKESSLKFAALLTTSEDVKHAIQKKNRSQISYAVNTVLLKWRSDTEFVTITDEKGNVLARADSDDSGDSLANMRSVSEALNGVTGSYIEPGMESKLSITSSAPVKDKQGNTIGVVTIGYKLDNPSFVDNLQTTTGMAFTVFLGDERVNTTIMQDEQRAMGTKMNPDVAKTVIGQKQSYWKETSILGDLYYTAYYPIINNDGEAVGAFSLGKAIGEIRAKQQWITLIAAGMVFVVTIISLLYFAGFSKKKIGAPIARLSMMAKELSEGKLNVDVLTHQSNDEIGELGKALESTSETLRNYITDISEHLTSLSNGDMTMPITQEYIGDFIPIQTALVKISDSLNHTLSAINISAEQVHSGSTQVSSGAQALAAGATEQASVIEELSASIEEVSEKAGKNAGSVRQATEYVEQSVTGVAESNEYMKQMLSSMKEISDASNEISKIIKVIDDIAFQTNILALNAAVEAARAGASGKGFAVVADEVRNLAGKSANAAKQTEELINTSVRAVKDGSKIAENTAKALKNVSTKSNLVKEIIAEIENASDAQATAISQITSGIEQISSVVQTNAATAEESSASSEELSAQAALLKEEISKFRLATDDGYLEHADMDMDTDADMNMDVDMEAEVAVF